MKCWRTSIKFLLSFPHYKGLFNDLLFLTGPSPSDPNMQAGGGDIEYLHSTLSTRRELACIRKKKNLLQINSLHKPCTCG